MKRLNLDWGAIVIIVTILLIMGSSIVDDWRKKDLIKACITQGKYAVIEHGSLKECK